MEELKNASMEDMRNYLASRDVKPSFQRLKILDYLRKSRAHPSVDTIFNALYEEIPTLSRTTIYNTLKLFTRHGIVNTLTIAEGELRYDFFKSPHAHFQCHQCGQVLDIVLDTQLFGTQFIEGHKADDVQINFKGLCKNCLKKGN